MGMVWVWWARRPVCFSTPAVSVMTLMITPKRFGMHRHWLRAYWATYLLPMHTHTHTHTHTLTSTHTERAHIDTLASSRHYSLPASSAGLLLLASRRCHQNYRPAVEDWPEAEVVWHTVKVTRTSQQHRPLINYQKWRLLITSQQQRSFHDWPAAEAISLSLLFSS